MHNRTALAMLFTLALFACSSSAGTDNLGAKVGDGFANDDGHWTIVGDAQSQSVKPDYSGTGGNPDGLISAKDDVTGGVWYFLAPQRYLGDNSSTYGQLLTFDLKVTPISSPFDAPDVILESGQTQIGYDTSPDPGTTWTSYSVPLSETGWKLTDGTTLSTQVTAEQFKSVLKDMTGLRIRGEFNTGADTGYLDNVRFGYTKK